ncbi:MAG: tetratricopeptide repeat protein [Verrucomicrobia bacterium]|nr:tetratricopeptide repeat protein [Verrucomicrobiota bacterium]
MVEETLKSLSEKAEAASNAGKLQEAIRLYDEMLTFALQHKVGDRTVAEIQRDRAKALTTRGKPHEAIEAAKEARSLFRALEDKRGMASANNTIGLNYDHLGEYSLAAFHYLDSLQVLRELKFEPGIAQVLSNLGLTLAYIGAYEEALEYLQEGLEMWRKGPTSLGLAMAYANIAFVMCETHRAKESELYHQKALEIYIKENAIAHQSNAYCNLAVLAQETGDMQKMDQLTAKALEIAEQSGSKLRVAIALNSRGNFYTHSGDRQQARNVLLQALALFKEIDVPRGVALALKDLSSCAEDAGQALAHLREGLKIAEHANLIPVQLAILELLHSQQVKQDLWREAHSTYQTLSALKTRLLNDRAEFKIRSIHLELELSQSRMETALQRERSDALQKRSGRSRKNNAILRRKKIGRKHNYCISPLTISET